MHLKRELEERLVYARRDLEKVEQELEEKQTELSEKYGEGHMLFYVTPNLTTEERQTLENLTTKRDKHSSFIDSCETALRALYKYC